MTVNYNRRPYLWGVLAILGVFLILPLLPYALAEKDSPILVPNPGADLWRDARRAPPGTTQVGGVESGVLISDAGEHGRDTRAVRALFPGAGPGSGSGVDALGAPCSGIPGWNGKSTGLSRYSSSSSASRD